MADTVTEGVLDDFDAEDPVPEVSQMLPALGINPDATTTQINSDLDHLVSVGAQALWLVVAIEWAFPADTSGDVSVLAKYDAVVNGASARGLPIILQIHGNPGWNVVAGGHTDTSPPWHGPDNATERANYVTMVHAFIARYSTGGDAYSDSYSDSYAAAPPVASNIIAAEIWNEPNLGSFWAQGPSPADYARLLHDLYLDIKATWPTIQVVGHNVSRNDIGWIDAVYVQLDSIYGAGTAAANSYYFDQIGVHPYCGDATSGYDPASSHADEVGTGGGALDPDFLGYRRMRDAVIAKEATTKNVAIGEFGYATLGSGWFLVDETTRAAYLASAIDLAADDGFVSYLNVYFHRIQALTNYLDSFNIHGTTTEAAFTAASAALLAVPPAPIPGQQIPELALRVGFTVGPGSVGNYLHVGDPIRGKVGTGQAAPVDATITLPPELVLGGTIKRGANTAESPVIRYEAGSGSWQLDNGDRRFEPSNLAGPYVAGGVSQIRPMRIVSFAAKWAGVSYQLWYGYSDLWPCDYDTPGKAITTLLATGIFKVLAGQERTPVAAVGASERTGTRIGRILDSVSWSATARILALGQTTCQATTLADNPLEEAQKVSDTEIGHLYEGEAGHVVFGDRYISLTDPRATSPQVTWQKDTPYTFSGLGITHEDVFANRAKITRIGGTEQVADDAASQADFLVKTHEDSDLWMQTDGAASDYAHMIVDYAGEPALRFSSLTVDPELNPEVLWPVVLGAKLGDRHRIIGDMPGGGTPVTQDVFVRGIEHTFDQPIRWETTFTYQAATSPPVLPDNLLKVGDPILGRVGYNKAA